MKDSMGEKNQARKMVVETETLNGTTTLESAIAEKGTTQKIGDDKVVLKLGH